MSECIAQSPRKKISDATLRRHDRITGVKMGHIRALTAVKDVKWSRDRGCLKTVVTFSNDQTCYAYSKISKKNKGRQDH